MTNHNIGKGFGNDGTFVTCLLLLSFGRDFFYSFKKVVIKYTENAIFKIVRLEQSMVVYLVSSWLYSEGSVITFGLTEVK